MSISTQVAIVASFFSLRERKAGSVFDYPVCVALEHARFEVVKGAVRRFQVRLVLRLFRTREVRLHEEAAGHGILRIQLFYHSFEVFEAPGAVRPEPDGVPGKFDAQKKIAKQAQGAFAAFAEEGVQTEHIARSRIVDLDWKRLFPAAIRIAYPDVSGRASVHLNQAEHRLGFEGIADLLLLSEIGLLEIFLQAASVGESPQGVDRKRATEFLLEPAAVVLDRPGPSAHEHEALV